MCFLILGQFFNSF